VPLPELPAEDLGYTRTVWNTWPTGYCADVTVTNHGALTGTWTVEVPFSDAIDTLCEGTYSATSSSLLIRGPYWAPALAPGESHTVGYCAKLGRETPSGGTPQLTGTLTIFNPWPTGWCSHVKISNVGDGAAPFWTYTLAKPPGSTIFSSAYPYTQTAAEVTFSGGSATPVLEPGGSTGDFEVCASQ
jgi:cellulase/cellobiase CelA1